MRIRLEHPGEWAKVVSAVQTHGLDYSSRNGDVVEVLGAQIEILKPGGVVPKGAREGINYAIGAVEACQLVSGEAYPELQTRVARKMRDFQDGQVFHGSYGPRLRPQMENIIFELATKPDTRRAIATIWDPMYDMQSDRKDLPCTSQFQWFIRDGFLHQVVTMRSNDVVWGTVYDVFQFGWLQRCVAEALNVKVGRLVINVGSLHIYDATSPEIVSCCTLEHVELASPALLYSPLRGNGPVRALETWKMLRRHAKEAMDRAMAHDTMPVVGGWQWFKQEMW